MYTIVRILSLWVQLSYGEILKAIPAGKKFFFFLLVLLIHIFLLCAILLPGTIWGIYFSAISGLFLIWNICLDQYSGSFFKPIRSRIFWLEKKSKSLKPESSWEKSIKFLGEYARIDIPLAIGLLAGIVIACV
ncbi:MAG: hypothetical protein HUU50_21810 [Candidatus Brocadiae bacterium]|nr:hypothetical protein [Candidatus Brocadiia bacterium]